VIGNTRGQVRLHARLFEGVRRGVLIAESIWPNDAYPDGKGINTVTGADAIAPYGGAAFHDNKVWIRPAFYGCEADPRRGRIAKRSG
jgi:anaerobic selenocysteine-containing dehydrogenase